MSAPTIVRAPRHADPGHVTYCEASPGCGRMCCRTHWLTPYWQAHYGARPVVFASEAEAREYMTREWGWAGAVEPAGLEYAPAEPTP